MTQLADLQTTQSGINTVQYLMALAGVMALTVAALASLSQGKARRLADRLHIGWLTDLLLPQDPQQRVFCLRYMLGSVNGLAGIAALNYGVSQGVIDPAATRGLTITSLVVIAGFYVMYRTELSLRLPDPSLTSYQIFCTELLLAWGYYIGGPGKPVALLLLLLILMFCMFATNTRTLIRASVIAAVAFGGVMSRIAYEERDSPTEPKLQLVYFCVLLVMLVSLCFLVIQLTAMRVKSMRRKQELTEALARIQELATRDALTGLFNRRHMLDLVNSEVQRSIRSGRTFCIGMIDVDHFKSINDMHGHSVGDQVLSSTATTITAGLRGTDVVARWGGEEFLVMFTDTDCDTAHDVLSRIQKALAHTVVSAAAPSLRIAFSAGITCYDAEESITRTIDRADRALYMAKEAGRNRTIKLEPEQRLNLVS